MIAFPAAARFRPPAWLEATAWLMLIRAGVSALVIVYDILVRGHRQKMAIMDVVYPVTALYWGPATVWFYFRYGRQKSNKVRTGQQVEEGQPARETTRLDPALSKAVSHCGAGCTLGDIAGE